MQPQHQQFDYSQGPGDHRCWQFPLCCSISTVEMLEPTLRWACHYSNNWLKSKTMPASKLVLGLQRLSITLKHYRFSLCKLIEFQTPWLDQAITQRWCGPHVVAAFQEGEEDKANLNPPTSSTSVRSVPPQLNNINSTKYLYTSLCFPDNYSLTIYYSININCHIDFLFLFCFVSFSLPVSLSLCDMASVELYGV